LYLILPKTGSTSKNRFFRLNTPTSLFSSSSAYCFCLSRFIFTWMTLLPSDLWQATFKGHLPQLLAL
jgi:hypothetical protein